LIYNFLVPTFCPDRDEAGGFTSQLVDVELLAAA
jgi:hypothetical protein